MHFNVFGHRLMCFVAAFSVRFYANEMVFASHSGNLAAARNGLNISSGGLRTWHERLLFGSSTQQLAPGAVQYQAHDAVPAYRSTPVVEQVRCCFCAQGKYPPALIFAHWFAIGACNASSLFLRKLHWLSQHLHGISNRLQVAHLTC